MRFLVAFSALLIINFLFAEPQGEFGSFTIKVNDQVEQSLDVIQALIYQRASLTYDTTAQIQDDNSFEVLYYPQIYDGPNHVLRLILKYPETDTNTGEFYELYINLGDSLKERIELENEVSKVFLTRNGLLMRQKQSLKNLSGYVLLLEGLEKQEIISGELHLEFEAAFTGNANELTHVKMDGNFKVPLGEYRAASISSAKPARKKIDYKTRLYTAIAISVLIVLAFGIK